MKDWVYWFVCTAMVVFGWALASLGLYHFVIWQLPEKSEVFVFLRACLVVSLFASTVIHMAIDRE